MWADYTFRLTTISFSGTILLFTVSIEERRLMSIFVGKPLTRWNVSLPFVYVVASNLNESMKEYANICDFGISKWISLKLQCTAMLVEYACNYAFEQFPELRFRLFHQFQFIIILGHFGACEFDEKERGSASVRITNFFFLNLWKHFTRDAKTSKMM